MNINQFKNIMENLNNNKRVIVDETLYYYDENDNIIYEEEYILRMNIDKNNYIHLKNKEFITIYKFINFEEFNNWISKHHKIDISDNYIQLINKFVTNRNNNKLIKK